MKKWKKIILIVIFYLVIFQPCAYADEIEDEMTSDEIWEMVSTNNIATIRAKSALLYDVKYDKILYEKNANEKLPNASTTKILTAIVAYENANVDDIVTVSENAARIGGSTIQLRKGNKVLLRDLMKGLLICSGNDAAIAIAEHVGRKCGKFLFYDESKSARIGSK